MAYLKNLLSKISGMSPNGAGLGDGLDDRSEAEKTKCVQQTILDQLRNPRGDNNGPSGLEVPNFPRKANPGRPGPSAGIQVIPSQPAAGLASYLPGLLKMLDPFGHQPPQPHAILTNPQMQTVLALALQDQDDDDFLYEPEVSKEQQLDDQLRKGRLFAAKIGENNYEYCKRLYPKEYHPFLARYCKKDCRIWLWKTATGQRIRRVMRERGINI